MGKRDYLYEELGEGTVELMKTIKKAVDPLNLFNPGKVRRRQILHSHRTCTHCVTQLYPDKPSNTKRDH